MSAHAGGLASEGASGGAIGAGGGCGDALGAAVGDLSERGLVRGDLRGRSAGLWCGLGALSLRAVTANRGAEENDMV
eukprot:scaffold79142_cov15-Tisochrysis_lutea.AAC.1